MKVVTVSYQSKEDDSSDSVYGTFQLNRLLLFVKFENCKNI